MSVIAPTFTHPAKGVMVVTWASIVEGDTATKVTTAQFSRKCFQTKGTFGSATIVAQGSNDGGTTFANLTDHGDTAISHTSASIDEIGQNPLDIRPSTSGGSGSSVTVVLTLSKD